MIIPILQTNAAKRNERVIKTDQLWVSAIVA